MYDVSIIIVSYNTKDLLNICIESIIKNTKKIKYEIIIIDNGSIDGTLKYLDDIKNKINNITIIKNKKNLGFGAANNIGIKYAKGKYILFLNSDTKIVNNAIKIFYDYMEKKQDNYLAIIGCMLINSRGEIIHSYDNIPTISSILRKELHIYNKKNYDKYDNVKKEIIVGYITGADIFIPKKIVDKFEYFFNEDFFMYFEDAEIQLRLKRMGYKRCIISGPKIIHYESKSSKNIVNKKIIYDKSKYIYIKKYDNKLGNMYSIIIKIIDILKSIFNLKYNMNLKFKYLKAIINNN